jgi:hypothetical protein
LTPGKRSATSGPSRSEAPGSDTMLETVLKLKAGMAVLIVGVSFWFLVLVLFCACSSLHQPPSFVTVQ